MPSHPSPRNLRRAVACLAGTLLLVSACGGTEDSASNTDAGLAGDSGVGEAYPVTIEHQFGETEITDRPQRIVTLGITDHDPLLALGVTPIAVHPGFSMENVGPWAEELLGDAEPKIFPSATDPDPEEVLALAPDLIIGVTSAMDQTTYDALSELVPTVVRSADQADFAIPWQEHTEVIGQAVGKPDEAAALIEETETLLQETAEQNPELAGKTGATLLPNPDGGYWPYTDLDPRGQFLSSMGMRLPDALAELDDGASFYLDLSAERMDLLEADVLVVLERDGDREAAEDDAVFQALDVVERDDVIWLATGDPGLAMAHNTVLSIPFVIDELVPQLVEKVR
ncbi:iron-siderophore ABC transporter substrate-binding protein [Actinoalloteichus hymeniacidonis]|uniref:ABC-type Fe3+-hydroxamate transport system, periplasmic component n=1 Tax=Actinoalloteichus hymeniacidonis TaxID=340345 RepID=A0AAC9MXI8_9PSEU|nr:iron-siderophore ABC transporter substrate-binding protein [Actinoalloteichus hymeniacidonis]AOS63283.1 ABC-type Fe3+-hydroxamate transport system, periplasmic component [Actinoalloteichus hymeniacidonis]MBB5908678.1 iron complex transport system substrate-binding protein [Actinoalloteichus hymeniacidonis]